MAIKGLIEGGQVFEEIGAKFIFNLVGEVERYFSNESRKDDRQRTDEEKESKKVEELRFGYRIIREAINDPSDDDRQGQTAPDGYDGTDEGGGELFSIGFKISL
jgi:hypothetical protein